ncbi:MAG: PAS domain-containing sensor histidine kinase, partial [Desulfobacteraceae bacterium]
VFGYDVDELIGNSPLELMSDKEAKRLIRIFNRIKNNAETIYALESINLHKDGREIIIESNGVPILDDDGKLAGYRGVSRNITERKRSHERLKKYSKLKERLLISGSMEDKMKLITDGVLHILNVDSVRIWMDRKCESKDSPNIKCKYAEFVNNKKSHKCSLKIISESGSHIPQKDNISHSAPFGCYEIRRTLESKDFGFVTNDFKKDLLEFNGKKTEQYNWTAFAGFRLQSQQENTIGVLSVFSKKSFSSGEETLLKAIAGTTSEVILAVLSEDGLRLKTKELSIANKDLEKYKNHLEDLVKERTSELKKSLDDLKQAQNQLVQSEKMAALGSLVAGVAHEINTPVGIGVTTASHLEQETRTFMEKYKSSQITRKEFETYAYVAEESSAMILSNLTRAADLIQSFKRVAVDQSNEIKTNFKIKEYIDEILKSLNSKFKKTKHRIVVNCQKDFEVNNYPGAFSQIMTNLLMNSLIHGFENIDEGIVTIQIERSDDTAQIEYRDNGIGISKENMEKLFEPFFTTKRGQGGSGLGMHVTYNLVTQTMKGTLTCFSSPGEGTRFVLSFPLNLKD